MVVKEISSAFNTQHKSSSPFVKKKKSMDEVLDPPPAPPAERRAGRDRRSGTDRRNGLERRKSVRGTPDRRQGERRQGLERRHNGYYYLTDEPLMAPSVESLSILQEHKESKKDND